MVTGVETAGLVLAALPIIFRAFEGYKKGCEPLREWRHLPRVLRAVIQRFEVLQLFLQDHIRKLLSPLLNGKDEIEALCQDLNSPKWKSPSLDKALHRHLGNARFEKYFETITNTYESMRRVLEILDVNDNPEKNGKFKQNLSAVTDLLCDTVYLRRCMALTKSRNVTYIHGWKRILVPLRKASIQAHLDQIDKNICILEKLLENSINLASLKRESSSREANFFRSVRESAFKIHAALDSVWNCGCPECHIGCLRLQHRLPPAFENLADVDVAEYSGHFKVAFSVGPFTESGLALWESTMIQSMIISSNAHQGSRNASKLENIQEVKIRVNHLDNHLQRAQDLPTSSCPRKITNFCSALSKSTFDNLGVISDQQSVAQTIICHRSAREKKRLIKLSEVMKDSSQCTVTNETSNQAFHDPLKLTRIQRYEVAKLVASSVLQLCGTPWLDRLSTQNVSFWATPDSHNDINLQTRICDPVVLHKSWQANPTFWNRSKSADTRDILFRLAVVLLELCFGELLQDQSFYADYCGPNRKPHDQTDRSAANRWCDCVPGEAGPQFFEAVRRCLDCNFGLATPNYDDQRFLQLVYENVVIPLNQTVDSMSGVIFPHGRFDLANR